MTNYTSIHPENLATSAKCLSHSGRCLSQSSSECLSHSGQTLRGWWREVLLKYRLQRERRQLSRLSDAALADIGISRLEAEIEARRRDIPRNRISY